MTDSYRLGANSFIRKPVDFNFVNPPYVRRQIESANSYIRKPVDFNQFAEAVRQLGMY